MSTFGGVFSLELENEPAATAFAAALSTIKRATSLGGTETLIEHRASIEPPARRTSPPGLLRVSVGLEDVDDLIHDMTVALDIAMNVMTEQN
jgi:cystathionine gamma-synthase